MSEAVIAIDERDILDYQNIYRKRFGTEVNKDEATTQLYALLRQMLAVFRPVKQEHLLQLKNVDEKEDLYEPAKPAPEN
jgi:hypothetical protein